MPLIIGAAVALGVLAVLAGYEMSIPLWASGAPWWFKLGAVAGVPTWFVWAIKEEYT